MSGLWFGCHMWLFGEYWVVLLVLPLTQFPPKHPPSAVADLRHSLEQDAANPIWQGREHSADPVLQLGVVSVKAPREGWLPAGRDPFSSGIGAGTG